MDNIQNFFNDSRESTKFDKYSKTDTDKLSYGDNRHNNNILLYKKWSNSLVHFDFGSCLMVVLADIIELII